MNGAHPPTRLDWLALGAITIVAMVIYFPVLSIPPFSDDNLYALAWVDAVPATSLFSVDPVIYPEWRPLPYVSLWLESRVIPLGAVALQFAINVALWALCAWLAYSIARQLGASLIGASAAAAIALTDPRATSTLTTLVDRQGSMACAFGLMAIVILLRQHGAARDWPKTAAIVGLLICSALSKEYGLSFAVAVAVAGAWQRRSEIAWPPLAAMAIYVLLRVAVAGGAATPYCEEMYLFFNRAERCVDPLHGVGLVQMSYNVAATIVNLPLRGLLSGTGEPFIGEHALLTGLAFTALAAIAVIKGPAPVRLLALVPLANGLLSFMVYRDRNHLAGACALAILSGLGLSIGERLIRSRSIRVATVAIVTVLIVTQTAMAIGLVREKRQQDAAIDLCASEIGSRPVMPPFIARVKTQYGLPDPDCQDGPR